MKLLHELTINLISEPDIFGNQDFISLVWTNQMYLYKQKYRTLSDLWAKYKKYLTSYLEEKYPELNWLNLEENLFISYTFYIKAKTTKEGRLDQRYIYDCDNLIKPVQDVLTWIGLIKDDKYINSFITRTVYNEKNKHEIVIKLYKYNKDEIDKLYNSI